MPPSQCARRVVFRWVRVWVYVPSSVHCVEVRLCLCLRLTGVCVGVQVRVKLGRPKKAGEKSSHDLGNINMHVSVWTKKEGGGHGLVGVLKCWSHGCAGGGLFVAMAV